jgi:hypothetical protein
VKCSIHPLHDGFSLDSLRVGAGEVRMEALRQIAKQGFQRRLGLLIELRKMLILPIGALVPPRLFLILMHFFMLLGESIASLLFKVLRRHIWIALKVSDSVLVLFDRKIELVQFDKEDADASVILGIEGAEFFLE